MIKKLIVFFVGLISLNIMAMPADEFKNDIRSLDNLMPIKYSKLSVNEKTVINHAIKMYLLNFASCGNVDFTKSDQTEQIYELRNYSKYILFRSVPFSEADQLNGVIWRGDIVVGVGRGSAREILRGGNYGQWSTIGDAHLRDYGYGGGLYKGTLVFYKNDLYDYEVGKIQGVVSKSSSQLSCPDINYFMSNAQPIDADSPARLSFPYRATDFDLKDETRAIKLKTVVLETGSVESVDVLDSSGLTTLDGDVKYSIKKSKFKPYIDDDGVAKRAYIEQEYKVEYTDVSRDLIAIDHDEFVRLNDISNTNKFNRKTQRQSLNSYTLENQLNNSPDVKRIEAELCRVGVKSKCK